MAYIQLLSYRVAIGAVVGSVVLDFESLIKHSQARELFGLDQIVQDET